MSIRNSSVAVLSPRSFATPDGHSAVTRSSTDIQRMSTTASIPSSSTMTSSHSHIKSPVSPTSHSSTPDTSQPPEVNHSPSKSNQLVPNGDGPQGRREETNPEVIASIRTSAIKETKPPISIPPTMASSQPSTASSDKAPTLSRKSSRYTSGAHALTKHASIASLTASRPAPPSPASQPASRTTSRAPSRKASQALTMVRRQSNLTERVPTHKQSTSSMRRVSGNTTPSGLTFTTTRRLSGLLNQNGSNELPERRGSAGVVDGLGMIGEGGPNDPSSLAVAQPSTEATTPTINPPPPNSTGTTLVPLSNSDSAAISRNLSNASAATSGSSSSTPSDPAARHASELEAIYASWGYDIGASRVQSNRVSPAPTPPPELESEPEPVEEVVESKSSTKSRKMAVDMGDECFEWHRTHPIFVRDYGFDEDDGRFSLVPIEATPLRDRANLSGHSVLTPTLRGRNKFGGFVGGYMPPGRQYAPWDIDGDDEEDEEDEDDWGFPVGTISGSGAPLGTTRGGTASKDLRNRNRAYGGLGSRGVGGKYVDISQSEEESSGFYEESGEEELFGQDGEAREEDEEEYGGAAHTPSNDRSHFDFLRPIHPDGDGDIHDGALGDEDISDHSPSSPMNIVRPGIYRAIYDFVAEGETEMNLAERQLIWVLGSGGGEGWAIARRGKVTVDVGGDVKVEGDEGDQGLVPESYLEPYILEDDELL